MTSRKKALSGGSGSALILPWLVGTLILVLVPLLVSIALSFLHWDGVDITDVEWVSTRNYKELLGSNSMTGSNQLEQGNRSLRNSPNGDAQFYRSMENSLVFAVFAAPLNMLVAMCLALLLNTPLKYVGTYRAMVYLPHVLGGVATILIWSWIFNPTFGPVNVTLKHAYEFLDPVIRLFVAGGTDAWKVPGWLTSEAWCKPALICIHAWTAGGSVFIFLAALQGVDSETRLASLLDGADAKQRFLHITLPQLTPAILFTLVTGFVATMQSFNYSYLLYNRAQNDGLLFVVLYVYRCAFEPPYRLGYASAIACVLFLILLIGSLSAVGTSRKWVHYES